MKRLPVVAVALTVVLLAGCGGDDPSSSESEGVTSIPGKLGTAKIEGTPKRVVAVDVQSADAALALGVTPVAMARVSYAKGGILPWTKAALGGDTPAPIDEQEISVEDVAAAKPDVILALGSSNVGKVADQLKRVAPVVSYAKGPVTDTWEEATVRAGRALRREDRARALVRRTRGRVEAVAGRAGLRGKTVSLFNFVGKPYLVKEPDDASVRFFASLGMKPPPAARGLPQSANARTEISLERVDVMDADVILGTSPNPDTLDAFAKRPVFQRLDGVRNGHYDRIDITQAVALAFPSALSIDWALRNVVPIVRRTAS